MSLPFYDFFVLVSRFSYGEPPPASGILIGLQAKGSSPRTFDSYTNKDGSECKTLIMCLQGRAARGTLTKPNNPSSTKHLAAFIKEQAGELLPQREI